MSRFEAPPGIVTNGLVLNLDAGDPDSYTRSQPPYIEVLVVAGGGGGSGNFYDDGAGGGAGGLIYNSAYQLTNASAITVTIGAGGAASTGGQGGDGGNSVFGSLTAIGGGGGAAHRSSGRAGGSGGGSAGAYEATDTTLGGAGTPGQGCDGGTSIYYGYAGSGGGGAGAPGVGGTGTSGKNGGIGQAYSISGTSTYYAGGGGGYGLSGAGTGGLGGGGNGGNPSPLAPIAGGTNTGGGGGGGRTAGQTPFVGTVPGGSGIVIVRYPGLPAATGGTITYVNGYTIHIFTSSGTFTPYLWNDVSGNGNNGTLINGIGFNSYQNGGGLIFDGTDDYIQTGATNLSANIGTINMWIKTGFTSTSGAPYYLIDTRDSTNVNNIALYYYNPQGGFVIYGNSNTIMIDSETFSSNTYLMVTLSYNFTIDNYAFYINGTLGTSSTSGYSSSGTITKTTLGSRYNQASSEFFIGNIFVTQIYNRTLSAAEITQNYNAQKSRFGL
jgi:hypothetical protein